MFLNYSKCFERHTAHHQELRTVIAACGFTYVCGCRQLSCLSGNWVPTQPWQLLATTNVCKTRGCNYSFEFLMMSGVSLETFWAIKEHWNNKFHFTVASYWLFLYDLYYDARIHEHQFYVISFLRCYKNAGSWSFRTWQFGCFAGIITTSGRMIGERLSASGTRLNTTSPVQSAFHGNKSSTESVPRSSTGGLKSVSRQSLLDIVSCRLGVGRNKQQQQHQVRTDQRAVCSCHTEDISMLTQTAIPFLHWRYF